MKWNESVHDLLRQGFGVEDIAIRIGCTAERVRREVNNLRQTGRLRDVLGLPERSEG